jgi:hypothetical protein
VEEGIKKEIEPRAKIYSREKAVSLDSGPARSGAPDRARVSVGDGAVFFSLFPLVGIFWESCVC